MSGGSKKIISNSFWLIVQQCYSMVTSIVMVALIARHLGPSDYGLINYCASIITIFTTLAGLGLDNVIVSEVIRRPEKEGSYLGTALVMRLIASVVSYPLILGVIAVINPGNSTLMTVAALQALGMVFQTYEVLVYWFRIKLKIKYVSIALIIAVTVMTVMRIVLLVQKASVGWFALAMSVQAFAAAIIIAACFVKKSDVKMKASMADIKALLKLSYNCIISSMSIIIYMHADKIILEKITDTAHVGIYSAAVMLATYWQFIPMALIDSARPVVLEKRKTSKADYIGSFKLVMAGANLLSFVFALLMSCLGRFCLAFVYGDAYLDAFIPLVVLSWASFIAVSGCARSIWITGESFYKYDKWFTVSAAVINILLDILFIRKMGIVGAAVATIITYAYEVFIVPLFFRDTRVFPGMYFASFKMIPRFISDSFKLIRGKFKRNS